MLNTISNSWQEKLNEELQKDYFKELILQVENEYEENICFPPKELIFNAFNSCSFEDVKVVIIGQDPYHGEGEANGLCFSVNNEVKIPPSLRNIYTEIASDLNSIFLPTNGNLQHWANQGVLMLNASLTVRKDTANSHKHLKWNIFTDEVIRMISDEKEHVVFLLWGAFAQKKGAKIDKLKHLVLESGHPSFAHSHKKWFGNKHFSQTNDYLERIGKKPIDWF
ncbi:uracil-DNA glycosylase [uncultured Flavobacterium sp.]|uniref:uracil-DNA glycosylase n=1 Tax=uncultured Flavobacterium sp. TaxID=165435 RepID=UPI0030EC6EFE|tara:strand:+ start:53451 stop:54119 length:669 start_codon:yes stop_codon:yes gene_type:complete